MIGDDMKLVKMEGLRDEHSGGTIVLMTADCALLSQCRLFEPKGETYAPHTVIPTLEGKGTNAKVIDTFLFCHLWGVDAIL